MQGKQQIIELQTGTVKVTRAFCTHYLEGT